MAVKPGDAITDEQCAYWNLAQDGRYGPRRKAEAMLYSRGIEPREQRPQDTCDVNSLSHQDWKWLLSLGVGSFGVEFGDVSGVYCLGTDDAGILYVGQSTNMSSRLFVHSGKSKSQDSVCVGLWNVCWTVNVGFEKLDFVESVLMLAIMPPLNSKIPNGYDRYLKNKPLAAESVVSAVGCGE